MICALAQAEYEREGISAVDVSFVSNKPQVRSDSGRERTCFVRGGNGGEGILPSNVCVVSNTPQVRMNITGEVTVIVDRVFIQSLSSYLCMGVSVEKGIGSQKMRCVCVLHCVSLN